MSRGFLSERSCRHGSYEEYDHSDQELYVDDQCCKNCRYYRMDDYWSYCVRPNVDEFDCPPDNGTGWCEEWEGR